MAQDRPEPTAPRWTDLQTRALSALILAPLAIGAIWVGGTVWAVVILAMATGLACEWVHVCGRPILSAPGLAVPGAILLAGAVALAGNQRAALLVLLAASMVIAWASSSGDRPIRLALGVPYVGLACVAMLWLRSDGTAGRANILFMMLIVWASDVGAYAAGRLIGGPKLAPRISPKKTWSGAVGGLLLAVLVGEAVAALLTGSLLLGRVAGEAALLGIGSQGGDLFESFMKRRCGVKDSSRIIPGHGGLLDRLDGVLAAAPVTALLALAAGRGVVLWQ